MVLVLACHAPAPPVDHPVVGNAAHVETDRITLELPAGVTSFEMLEWQPSADAIVFRDARRRDRRLPAQGMLSVPAESRLAVAFTAPDAASIAWANANRIYVDVDCTRPVTREIRFLRCTRADDAALAGLGALAVAIEAVVLLVADYIFELATAVVTAAVLGVVVAIFWLLLPLRGRARY